jgi:hypothetical protein
MNRSVRFSVLPPRTSRAEAYNPTNPDVFAPTASGFGGPDLLSRLKLDDRTFGLPFNELVAAVPDWGQDARKRGETWRK